MRALILILAIATSGAFAQQKDLNSAFEKARDAGEFPALIDRIGEEIKEKKFDAALANANRALEIEPQNPVALNARAATLIELGRYEDAEKDLVAALKVAPDFLPALFNEAESLFLQKKYSDAAVQFRLLSTKFPDNPLVKFKLYLAYHYSGRDDISKTVIESINFPVDGAAWYFTNAADRMFANDKSGAKKLIQTAESIHPKESQDYRDALKKLGLL